MTEASGVPAWHEDDQFWVEAAGPLFDERAWREAADQARDLTELLELDPPARILDLGCGPGRFALPLARLGFRVTGVDRTRAFLEQAERRAAEEGLEVELVEADMREFSRPGGFDAAISMLTSFGYFEDPAEDLRVVANVYASLEDGGSCLVDTYGKEVIARIFQPRDWKETDDAVWLYERRVTDGWSWMENRWMRIADGERREYRVGHRLFSGAELQRVLSEGGFSRTRSYGDLGGGDYDHEAARLVVVGWK